MTKKWVLYGISLRIEDGAKKPQNGLFLSVKKNVHRDSYLKDEPLLTAGGMSPFLVDSIEHISGLGCPGSQNFFVTKL